MRIDNTQSVQASTEAQVLVLTAQRTAEQREWEMLQTMLTARLADKDEWIATLQRSIVEPHSDPGAPVENDTDGV